MAIRESYFAGAYDTAKAERFEISFKALLSIYLIVPLCVAAQIVDQLFFGGYLQSVLPANPQQFFLFQILFGTPHILASSLVLFGNAEYVAAYRNRLAWFTLFIAAAFFAGQALLSYGTLFFLVATVTVTHVLRQQYGIAKAVCRLPPRVYAALLWLSVATGVLIYNGLFLHKLFTEEQMDGIKAASGLLAILLMIVASKAYPLAKGSLGKPFLLANVSLVPASWYLFDQGYYFLAIIGPRLVHDITAFAFYIAHDHNKHSEKPRNLLYHAWGKLHLPVVFAPPVLGIGLTVLLQQCGDAMFNALWGFLFGGTIPGAVSFGLIGYLGFVHYYTEATFWKGGSAARQYIGFKP